MMRKIFLALLCAASANVLIAQDQVDLQVPAYPAGVILGSPSLEVNRVGSYSSLVTALSSHISPGGNAMPTNFALEMMPYYFKSRKGSLENIGKPDLLRDLRVSLASQQVADPVIGVYSRLGVGLRTFILPGKVDKNAIYAINQSVSFPFQVNALAKKLADPANADKNISDLAALPEIQLNDTLLAYLLETADLPPSATNAEIATKILVVKDALIKELENPNKLEPSLYDPGQRYGSILELSTALALDFPTGDLGFSEINRYAFWLSYHYIPQKRKELECSALVRYSNFSYDPQVFTDDIFYADIGANLSYAVTKKLTVTGEYIYRSSMDSGTDPESKFDFTLSYAFKDNIVFQTSIDQFFSQWKSGVTDPTQLALSLIFGIKNE